MEKTETPRTDAAETKFLEGRSLTWMDVMTKSVAVFVEMRQLERELRDAQACIRDADERMQICSTDYDTASYIVWKEKHSSAIESAKGTR